MNFRPLTKFTLLHLAPPCSSAATPFYMYDWLIDQYMDRTDYRDAITFKEKDLHITGTITSSKSNFTSAIILRMLFACFGVEKNEILKIWKEIVFECKMLK